MEDAGGAACIVEGISLVRLVRQAAVNFPPNLAVGRMVELARRSPAVPGSLQVQLLGYATLPEPLPESAMN